jgi:peroxiredoxin
MLKPAVVAVILLSATPFALGNEVKLGKAAPPATLVTLDGQRISMNDLHGHTVILAFWATWCTPCREEIPLLSRYVDAHRDEGLMVLGFSIDDADNLDAVWSVAAQTHFPIGLLAASDAHGYGRIWRVPVSFVIDRDGILRYDGWKAAQPSMTESNLHQVVDPLLGITAHAADIRPSQP